MVKIIEIHIDRAHINDRPGNLRTEMQSYPLVGLDVDHDAVGCQLFDRRVVRCDWLLGAEAGDLDALVLASPLNWRIRDRIFPIAAGDVFFETPMLTTFAAFFLNALPIWRKKCGAHTLQRLRQRLIEEPCAYILFPEGTRSRDGSMVEFKPGLGMLVANTAVPVVPCYLEGCFEALGPGHKWPRRRRIRLYVGAPLDFSNVASNREGWTHIAKEAYTHVRRLMPGEEAVTAAAGD